MKITAIDPFSVREDRSTIKGEKKKPLVRPVVESNLNPVGDDGNEDRLFNLIEEAQKRAQKRKAKYSDKHRKRVLETYTLVLNGFRGLHERGKKFNTRG